MSKEMPHPPPPGFAPGPPPAFVPSPPPPPYNPGPPNIVIVNTQFGPESQRLTCPYCHANISTTVETESNTKTHIFALVLCLFGFWCCAPMPYCIDSCLVKKHYCPSCKAYLGESSN